MLRIFHFLFASFWLLPFSICQKQPLDYFLPPAKYDPAIPTPEQVFGFQIGEQHLSHDQLVMYYRLLDMASDRITLTEHARSHENRPLFHLTITSPNNHNNLQTIQNQHLALTDPAQSAGLDVAKMPIVLYQGFSIHGNEPSGANAATLVAYRLAASHDADVLKLLDEAVILFDPCFNPDGFHRFSTWANSNKNLHLTADNADREYDEPWPRGRTNHYWFDLNRDWLPGQQPESAGRIRLFQSWRPNILTDHHEMGTNSTFFFMPGVQSRVNPITPKRNQELTRRIGEFHAAALDEIGSLYFTEEGFDDFYYGKGSTYPDAQGCIGILFEQASSRGHLQDSQNGPISFAFTIRNQVRTALSTQRAAVSLRTELLDYQRSFYKTALEEAARDDVKAFVVGEKHDPARLAKFVEMVQRQGVKLYEAGEKITVGNQAFEPGSAYVIPLDQPQYRLIKGMFQRETSFDDSIFYDVSAWTLPLAFNLAYAELKGGGFSKKMLGKESVTAQLPDGQLLGSAADYAFAFDWDGYYAPAALYQLLEKGLYVKVASKPFQAKTKAGNKDFTYGAIVVPTQNQPLSGQELTEVLREAAQFGHVDIHGIATGLTPTGIDIGSGSMEPLHKPKVLLMVGNGVESYAAGEIWHLLDARYGLPVTKVDVASVSPGVLKRFNVAIMPAGSYGALNAETLKAWVSGGGVLIAAEEAVKWLENKQLSPILLKKPKEEPKEKARMPYASAEDAAAALELPGAIFLATVDITHPMCYGYRSPKLPVFRNSNQFYEATKNAYATPVTYLSEQPLMAGYVHEKFIDQVPGSPSVAVGALGSGRIICLTDPPSFRAFWYGTGKILANAVFFGHTVVGQTAERVSQ